MEEESSYNVLIPEIWYRVLRVGGVNNAEEAKDRVETFLITEDSDLCVVGRIVDTGNEFSHYLPKSEWKVEKVK